MRLDKDFYTKDAFTLAQDLLGKVICKQDSVLRKYRIIETEAYGGITDKAAHSYNDTHTPRTDIMYQEGGHLYIYFIYGMYHMLNIVASIKGDPQAVLVRAVEPLGEQHDRYPTNGPGKLCRYMGIDRTYNGLDLGESELMYIIDDGYKVPGIVASKRINVDYAEEDKERLWRFYIKNHPYVSVK